MNAISREGVQMASGEDNRRAKAPTNLRGGVPPRAQTHDLYRPSRRDAPPPGRGRGRRLQKAPARSEIRPTTQGAHKAPLNRRAPFQVSADIRRCRAILLTPGLQKCRMCVIGGAPRRSFLNKTGHRLLREPKSSASRAPVSGPWPAHSPKTYDNVGPMGHFLHLSRISSLVTFLNACLARDALWHGNCPMWPELDLSISTPFPLWSLASCL